MRSRPTLQKIMAAWLTVVPLSLLAAISGARAAEIELTVRKAVRDDTQPVRWITLRPDPVRISPDQTTATIAEEGTVRIGGKNVPAAYTVRASTSLVGITAIRLEVLTDPVLPRNGPGRASNGNFVLNELTLAAAKKGQPSPAAAVKLSGASADFSQDGFPVACLIDGKEDQRNGWAVNEGGADHWAILTTAADVGYAEGTGLTFQLANRLPNYQLGKFRLSVTQADRSRLVERWVEKTVTVKVDPKKTAIVIIDMWDTHPCQTMVDELEKLIPRTNKALEAARKLGITVVHAPSNVLGFYKDLPQRTRMAALPQHPPPAPDPSLNPPSPPHSGWALLMPGSRKRANDRMTRQHPDLEIADGDLIGDCNNSKELYNLCAERGITHLFYTGVATNMCVFGRAMGMKQMTRLGMNCYIIRDLTAAFHGTPQDPKLTPAQVTDKAVRHLEKHFAGSIDSRQLVEAAK